MTRQERYYRALLRLYPSQFRSAYEQEMLRVFRDQQRDGALLERGFWRSVMLDVLRSAPREWRAEIGETLHSGAATMKGMAIAALIVGTFEIVNTGAEVRAGGLGSGGTETASILLVFAGALLLVAAGIALLRRGRATTPFAMLAVGGCLASFLFLGATHRVLSVFAMLLGIGFPVVLLAFLGVDRGRSARVGAP
jgi:hypothetical protein